jgi:hypothetical protein
MKLHKIPVVAPLLTPALAAGIGGEGPHGRVAGRAELR